jgi:hypothetical protein
MGKASRRKWENRLKSALTSKPETPWWESNVFWTGFVSIILLVVGSVVKDLRWLLWLAWLCSFPTVWKLVAKIIPPSWLGVGKYRRLTIFLFIFGITITGGSLYGLNVLLEPESPDLIAEFDNPDDIHLVISNPTTATANQPKFMTVLVDLDITPVQLLPIPQQTGDYLRGKSSLLRIPILHYGNTNVLNIVKPHHTLLGWISLSCADCKKIRWYWLFYEYTVGGWYSESPTQPDSQLLMKMAKERNIAPLDEIVPTQKRMPIKKMDGIGKFPEQGPLR